MQTQAAQVTNLLSESFQRRSGLFRSFEAAVCYYQLEIWPLHFDDRADLLWPGQEYLIVPKAAWCKHCVCRGNSRVKYHIVDETGVVESHGEDDTCEA